jgi:sugar phosphate isomerase/epimerase
MPPVIVCLFASTPDIAVRGFLARVLTAAPDEIAARAIAWGYDGIEFMADPLAVPDPVAFEVALRRAGAVMPVVNSGRMARQGLILLHADAAVRRKAVAGFKALLDFAGHFRARVHLGMCRGTGIPGATAADMDAMADDVFRELVAHAERAGATILLEPSEADIAAYINTMDEVMAWVDRIGSPAFLPMLDTHQLAHAEPSIPHGIRAARGRAPHVHLFDPGRWPPGLLTDTPTLDWPAIAALLRATAFRGSASLVLAPEGDPEPAARASAAFVRRLLA